MPRNPLKPLKPCLHASPQSRWPCERACKPAPAVLGDKLRELTVVLSEIGLESPAVFFAFGILPRQAAPRAQRPTGVLNVVIRVPAAVEITPHYDSLHPLQAFKGFHHLEGEPSEVGEVALSVACVLRLACVSLKFFDLVKHPSTSVCIFQACHSTIPKVLSACRGQQDT